MKSVAVTLLFCFCGMAMFAQSLFEARTFTGTASTYRSDRLDQSFSHYEVYDFSVAALHDFLQSNTLNHYEVRIQLGKLHQWDLFLFPNDMRGENYRLRIGTEGGIVELPRGPNITYIGELAGSEGASARLSIAEELFMGYVTVGDEEWFIEPLSYLQQDAPKGLYILYRAKDVLSEGPATCGVTSIRKNQPKIPHDLVPENPENDCKEVQLGLASDFELFEALGSAAAISNQTLTVTNMMEGIYISEFNLSYIITDFYIATTEATDPWTNSLVSEDVLNAFRSWAPAAGGLNTHDIGQLWTGRDLEGCNGGTSSVIGCGFIGTLCGPFRYNVCEGDLGDLNCLRTLSAHEIGHNLGGQHDDATANTIMQPIIDCDAMTFSAANTDNINDILSDGFCLDDCGANCDLEVALVISDEVCAGAGDGSASFTATTSFGPVTFCVFGPVNDCNSSGVFSTLLPGNYTFAVFDEDFAPGSCTQDGNFSIGTVFDSPTADAFSNSPICSGDNLDLGVIPGAGMPGYTYEWSGPLGFSSNLQNPTILAATADATGFYTVTVTDQNGCTATDILFVMVNQSPILAIGNSGPICEGEDLGLTVAVAGVGGYVFLWTGPNGFSSMDQNPVIVGAPLAAAGAYTVKVTDLNDCMTSATTTAVIFENPTVSATSNSPICEGEDLELDASASGGTGLYVYSWSGPNGFISDEEDPVIPNAALAASGIYTVEVTDGNGCTDMDTTAVTVNPNPTVNATSNSPICNGDHLFLKSNPSGGTPPYTFEWVPLTGFLSQLQDPKIFDATFDDAGVYKVQVTDINGCQDVSQTEVFVEPNIEDPGAITGDQYFCGPGYDAAPILSLAPATGASPVEYFWMYTTPSMNYWEVIPGATGLSYDPGVLYETTTFSRCARKVGCQKALEANFVTKTVGDEAPAYIDGPGAVCVGVTATYAAPYQAGATYYWNFGYGATPQYANTATVEVSWASYGLRTVELTIETATCIAFNEQDVFVTNSTLYCSMNMDSPLQENTADPETETRLLPSVYPNPFSQDLTIALGQSTASPLLLQLKDVQGRVVRLRAVPAGSEDLQLNLGDLPAGLYVLTLQSDTGTFFYTKVLKQ